MLNNYSEWFDKYLMSSYKYYVTFEETGMSDHQFDMLCKDLLGAWDTFEHPLKHLVDKDLLRCGSGFSIQYPADFMEKLL
tara:strand:- start:440 stop:679 length:240 start_codon:yes stop_codon:yes gene_type:complete